MTIVQSTMPFFFVTSFVMVRNRSEIDRVDQSLFGAELPDVKSNTPIGGAAGGKNEIERYSPLSEGAPFLD